MLVDEPGKIDLERVKGVMNLRMHPEQARIFYSDTPISIIDQYRRLPGPFQQFRQRYRLLTILRYILQSRRATP